MANKTIEFTVIEQSCVKLEIDDRVFIFDENKSQDDVYDEQSFVAYVAFLIAGKNRAKLITNDLYSNDLGDFKRAYSQAMEIIGTADNLIEKLGLDYKQLNSLKPINLIVHK